MTMIQHISGHIACGVLLGVIILLNRAGWGDPKWPLLGIAGLFVVWCVYALFSVYSGVTAIYRTGNGLAWLNTILAFIPLLVVVSVVWAAKQVPSIHDITTDWQSPPPLLWAKGARHPSHNPTDYDPANVSQQQQAYPDIVPIYVPLTRELAFDRVLTLVEAEQWQVQHADREAGVIEAFAKTAVMGFVDDVVIRLADANERGTRVDIRSASRIGRSDFGANAARIRQFNQQLQQ